MVECGLKVYDGAGRLARDLRVQVPDLLDQPTLDLVHRQCIQGLTCSYAVLEQGHQVRALFLHQQLVPLGTVVTGVRRRAPGRWVTHTLDLGLHAGGRGAWGPEMFFRQLDVDPERAWLAPLLLRVQQRIPTRRITLDGEMLHAWELRGDRYFYWEQQRSWQLFGAGNTPLLRLEQALHLADPKDVEAYLWAVGAIPLGRRRQAS